MTGKTCLYHRLQGHPFSQPDPTTSIQVATIPWSYKGKRSYELEIQAYQREKNSQINFFSC
jgi:hypothetical protein